MNTKVETPSPSAIPFDHGRLDRLMDEAGLDVIVITSKHNVQYLLGGYRFIFFSAMDAIGHSRYLPIVIYERGRPENAAYIGNKMEGAEHQNAPFWTPGLHTACSGTSDAAELAVQHLRKAGLQGKRIGIEAAFLPADAYEALRQGLGVNRFHDATPMMERMRAIKTPDELDKLRTASELITDSMLAAFAAAGEGSSKEEVVESLRREETARGLHFEYCLITFGASLNRAVSPQRLAQGDVLSLDSGGNYRGYIGDLCRMGVLGEPDAELVDLLAEIDAVQQVAIKGARPGRRGGDMIAEAEALLKKGPSAGFTDFFAHGMGLIAHEVPFLMTNHPVTYEGVDSDHPLEAGMVISVETTMLHPTRGFIKLEDTVAVQAEGPELMGARGRGWNRIGG